MTTQLPLDADASPAIRVLHVDDDPTVVDLSETYLERRDDAITVVTETDPTEAFRRLDDDAPIDCVVSDFQMPEMDGLELLSTVRAEYPNLPFVLFTGKGNEDIAARAINAGVSTYLRKGSTDAFDRLVNQVRNAVGHHRSERRARIARERLLKLYERTDGFFALGDDWTITYWNRVMAHRTGRTPDDVVGTPYLEAFPQAEGTDLYAKYVEAMSRSEAVDFETYYEPHDYWLRVRAYPVEDGLFVHSRDVTAEKERERELENRNRILESFANAVSHDLRNPLNVAEGRLELAQETGDLEHFERVATAHNRMRSLIDELLRIARDEVLHFETLALAASAEDAWKTVPTGEMELVTRDDARFEAHPVELRRLFDNLFWNAREHGDANEVRVGVLRDDGRPVGFFVEDDGTGIPPADRADVMREGYTTETANDGYGLSIVAEVAGLHDWTLSVASSDDGGARFEFRGFETGDD